MITARTRLPISVGGGVCVEMAHQKESRHSGSNDGLHTKSLERILVRDVAKCKAPFAYPSGSSQNRVTASLSKTTACAPQSKRATVSADPPTRETPSSPAMEFCLGNGHLVDSGRLAQSLLTSRNSHVGKSIFIQSAQRAASCDRDVLWSINRMCFKNQGRRPERTAASVEPTPSVGLPSEPGDTRSSTECLALNLLS